MIILETEVEMIAIAEEMVIATMLKKEIAIEPRMIVIAMRRILAAGGAIELFGERRLPRKNRPYHQQGWTSRWSV